MSIVDFSFWQAVAGGALIGLAAVLLMALNGRIAGVSGIVAGVLAPLRGEGRDEFAWRAAFAGGLILAPLAAGLFMSAPVSVTAPHPLWAMIIGGAAVGYGARLGSGCTSGHGVCGVARMSKRSLVATATFMTTAMVTVFILHRVIGV